MTPTCLVQQVLDGTKARDLKLQPGMGNVLHAFSAHTDQTGQSHNVMLTVASAKGDYVACTSHSGGPAARESVAHGLQQGHHGP